ncbi:MAG TPA: STAS domain-containing protein [Terriglobales bacterium]|nr:STAS domain-containing protein [Terriglobales bacterium]
MSRIADVLRQHEAEILNSWMQQMPSSTRRSELIGEKEFREQCTQFIRLLQEAAQKGDLGDLHQSHWSPIKEFLRDVTRTRVQQGFTPSQVATFVFSFKQPLFEQLRKDLASKPLDLAEETWRSNLGLDELGLFTTEVYQESREEVIRMQQQEMLELSTPVVKLWEGILALPLIGTLDSARTQVVMETLLEKIVETGSGVAIIDITGVPTVDTLVAQHLIKTVTAARLMGADCIISGIRPQIAQTIVHLGVGLGDVTTKASLADAFAVALLRTGLQISTRNA